MMKFYHRALGIGSLEGRQASFEAYKHSESALGAAKKAESKWVALADPSNTAWSSFDAEKEIDVVIKAAKAARKAAKSAHKAAAKAAVKGENFTAAVKAADDVYEKIRKDGP